MEALSHPDRVAFLLSIAATPDDNTPRLVFADWLEEYGGDPAQAKYIRRAIAWAAERPEPFPWQPSSGSPLRKCPCPGCALWTPSTRASVYCRTCGGTGDLFRFPRRLPGGGRIDPDCSRTVHFARGFPDSVECTAADVWREEDVPCPHCEDASTCPETNVAECSRCDCTGVIDTRTVPTEWAKAVVRVTPVTRFVVTDFVPAESARHGGWWRWYAGEARDEVPQVVFDLLAGEYPSDWRGAALVPYWRSGAAARDALAVALGKWVRAAAYPAAPGG